MIIAIDVHYRTEEAKIVAVQFENWEDATPNQVFIEMKTDIAEYEPGAFYKRELPCIIEVMKKVDMNAVTCIVVDGYVYLNDDDKKGLGYYVFDYFGNKIPVIGVAKTSFHQNTKNVRPILRGDSANPLYVTSIGIDVDEAAKMVQSMAGEFRMPTLLKLMDTLTKE
jgi:deoxyribonuclease V